MSLFNQLWGCVKDYGLGRESYYGSNIMLHTNDKYTIHAVYWLTTYGPRGGSCKRTPFPLLDLHKDGSITLRLRKQDIQKKRSLVNVLNTLLGMLGVYAYGVYDVPNSYALEFYGRSYSAFTGGWDNDPSEFTPYRSGLRFRRTDDRVPVVLPGRYYPPKAVMEATVAAAKKRRKRKTPARSC